jgi:ribosomal protein L19E
VYSSNIYIQAVNPEGSDVMNVFSYQFLRFLIRETVIHLKQSQGRTSRVKEHADRHGRGMREKRGECKEVENKSSRLSQIIQRALCDMTSLQGACKPHILF